MKVDESNYSILSKASDITYTDYEIKWFDVQETKGFIETDALVSMIQDLIYEIENLKEKYEDLEKDIEDNYKWVGNEWDRVDMAYESWRDNQ